MLNFLWCRIGSGQVGSGRIGRGVDGFASRSTSVYVYVSTSMSLLGWLGLVCWLGSLALHQDTPLALTRWEINGWYVFLFYLFFRLLFPCCMSVSVFCVA